MEEKKKRWRPSLTAYRELEKKLESQIEGTSQLVKDCDLWREKYQILKKKYDELLPLSQDAVSQVEKLTDSLAESRRLHNETLCKYGDLSAEHDRLAEESKKLRAENDRLKSRGFIDRLLNR